MKRRMHLPAIALAVMAVFSTAAAADDARAARLIGERCALCHGARGESSTELYPRLAGQHANYIAKQLADYQSGRRKNDTMSQMAADLAEADMKALGQYFEKQQVKSGGVQDADLAAVGKYLYNNGNAWSGVPACAFCHGSRAHGTDQLPRLAGQRAAYTAAQLMKFNQRERSNDNTVMRAVAAKLTELEIRALAEYVGGLE